jgi:hypothetical protein
LSAAVSKVIENYNQLKAEIDLAKKKAAQRNFVPLSQDHVDEFIKEARNLINRHRDINFNVQILCVDPSSNHFRKATELTNIFRSANIKAKYSNTMFSTEYNVVIKYSEDLPKDVVNEVQLLLKIVFKSTLYYEFRKSGGEDSKGNILIYFLGTPSFDNEGRVFYDTPIF